VTNLPWFQFRRQQFELIANEYFCIKINDSLHLLFSKVEISCNLLAEMFRGNFQLVKSVELKAALSLYSTKGLIIYFFVQNNVKNCSFSLMLRARIKKRCKIASI
jgi:hypothetical protein